MTAVLHVIASANRRGAEVFATDLHDALSVRGWSSSVVALSAALEEPGLDVEVLTAGHWARALPRLSALIRRVDVVVAHGSTSLPACALAATGTSTPVVYRSIGDPAYWSSDGLRKVKTNALLRRMATVVALWDKARDCFVERGLDPDRLWVIPNAIDTQAFPMRTQETRLAARQQLGIAPGCRLAVYLGAYSYEKAPEIAIQAVLDMPDVHLRMNGDGPLREQLKSAAAVAAGRIVVAGPTSDPARLLRAADVLVIPSRTEGIPGVLLEAAAIGVPVVASNVGGIPNAMATGIAGTLAQPADAASLAAGIADVLENTSSTRRAVLDDRFSLPSVAAAWARCLEDAVRPRLAA